MREALYFRNCKKHISLRWTKRFYCVKVKAHNENPHNYMADWVAKQASKISKGEKALRFYGEIPHAEDKRKNHTNGDSNGSKMQRKLKSVTSSQICTHGEHVAVVLARISTPLPGGNPPAYPQDGFAKFRFFQKKNLRKNSTWRKKW